MKKLGAALVLIAFTIGAQMVVAADNPPPKKPIRSGRSLTINGTAAQEAKSSGTSVTTSYEESNEASASSSSSSAPQPLEDQKIKTKSNIKND